LPLPSDFIPAPSADHLIIIGAPVDGEVTGDRPPLVFFGGRSHPWSL